MFNEFPIPYPDETFYSLCARFMCRTKLSFRAFSYYLTGIKNYESTRGLPGRLAVIGARLPASYPINLQDLVMNHTGFPYYATFAIPDLVEGLNAAITGSESKGVNTLLGLRHSSVKLDDYLLYCPSCVKRDRELWGEAYWHRVHQLPGVLVCPDHHIFLEESSILVGTRGRARFHHLDKMFAEKHLGQAIRPLNLDEKVLIEVAIDSRWLLNGVAVNSTLEEWLERYHYLLLKLGLSSFPLNRIDNKGISKVIRDYFGDEILERLQSLPTSEAPWINRIMRPKRVSHPLRNILLIRALGYSVDNLLAIKLPKQCGPWPCLNPIACHYKQDVIDTYEWSYSRASGHIRTFRCDCGFTYQRLGFEDTSLDLDARYQYSRITSYGTLWEARLREIWFDNSLSLYQIAEQLGVVSRTARQRARTLGLTIKDGKRTTGEVEVRLTVEGRKEVTKQSHRRKLLKLLRTRSFENRSELIQASSNSVGWLRRNDNEWLIACLNKYPKLRSKKGKSLLSGPKDNWKERDANLYQEIEPVAKELRSREGFPVKVTIEAISLAMNQPSIFKRTYSQAKLPRTMGEITRHLDTWESYTMRKIEYTKKQLIASGIPLSPYRICREAGIDAERAKNSLEIWRALGGTI